MNYSMFVLTQASRIHLARCLTESVFQYAYQKPDRILVVSAEAIPTEGWHPQVEVITGIRDLRRLLFTNGLSEEAFTCIFDGSILGGHQFLKYAIPRLCMTTPVLVSDDDVIFRGPCIELFDSNADFVFMDDPAGFYGENSTNLFLNNGWVKNFPTYYVCAGFYMMNKNFSCKKVVNEVILHAKTHRDEQSAVGMESMLGIGEILMPPKYIHGGYVHRRISDASLSQVKGAELIHMQSRFAYLRDKVPFLT